MIPHEKPRAQEETLMRLSELYASVEVHWMPPTDAVRATCRDAQGRKVDQFTVYADGSTPYTARSVRWAA